MTGAQRHEVLDALRLGGAWTAKFIADRSVEGVDDYVIRNAQADLLKIQGVQSRLRNVGNTGHA